MKNWQMEIIIGNMWLIGSFLVNENIPKIMLLIIGIIWLGASWFATNINSER